MKKDSHTIYNIYKKDVQYKDDYLACTYRVHEMQQLTDNSLNVLVKYKEKVEIFRRDYLSRILQKIKTYNTVKNPFFIFSASDLCISNLYISIKIYLVTC